jgi:glycerophosphoryl diester phosphodiesterase
VIHDESVDRTTDGHGPVRDFTFDELRRLDAGQGERIPSLEEVLETVRGHVRVLVELKGAGVEEAAVSTVRALGIAEDVTFTSFHLDRIARVRQLAPSQSTSAIFGDPPPDACARAAAAGARSIGINHRHLSPILVQEARDRRLPLRAWNPDTEAEIEAMVDLRVDGIGSNRPDLLLAVLRRRGLR